MSHRIAAVSARNAKGDASMQPATVQRYRRGKAPAPIESSDEDEEDEQQPPSAQDEDHRPTRIAFATPISSSTLAPEPTPHREAATKLVSPVVDASTDPRLQRLLAAQAATKQADAFKGSDLRSRNQPEGRKPVRQPALDGKGDEPLLEADEQAEDSSESETSNGSASEDEDSSSSQSDAPTPMPRLKPVFVPKSKRQATIPSVADQEFTTKSNAQREQDRIQESRELLEAEIKRELAARNATSATAEVDDTDGIDMTDEYAAWKQRELARLRRDRDARIEYEREQAEIERMRNMTPEERAAYEQEVRKRVEEAKSSKPKMKFLQKYYHKGAFYMDQDTELFARNYNEATLEDHFNREALPEVLQRRNFGRSGQTKWTHLAKEDTSSKDAGWYANKDLAKRLDRKRGGVGDIEHHSKRQTK